MKLKQQRIVITGGTAGIGYELVKHLHSDNEVIVIARDAEKLKQLSQECNGVISYQADLSKPEDVVTVANVIVKHHHTIDVLINNAAVQYTPTFLDDDFKYENISREITINLTSVCSLIYLLLPALHHDKPALILNINSGLALAPKTSSAIYCASKGALNIFTQSLRYQLENTNIKVQQAFLELVDTSMTQGRGNNKMPANKAALKILHGIEHNISDHDIGKVKLLRMLLRLMPSMAKNIMKRY